MPTQIFAYLRQCRVLILTAALSLFGVFTINLQPVHAATTWTVNTTADDAAGGTCGTPCTLRDALNSAANGDTIQFQGGLSGTILLVNGGLTITTNVSVNGPGAMSLAIDGNHAVTVFTINHGVTVSIGELTIQNGNNSNSGGGINNSGTLTITNGTIINNSSSKDGGGIVNQGTLTINNSTLSGNTAIGRGGGISSYGPLTINNSFLLSNSVNGSGGGISSFVTGSLTINSSTLSSNSASGSGGGIFNYSTNVTISNSTFSGNSASSSFGGGGLFAYGNYLTVSNSTFSSNSKYGISNYQSILNLFSDILAKNTGGTDIINDSGTITSLGYNLIGDATSSGIIATTGDQIGTSASPIDPKLAALTNNGGLTQTMALLTGSPAIGKGNCSGNNTVTPSAPIVTNDQRGVPRKTPICDVGAYESGYGTMVKNTDDSGAFSLRYAVLYAASSDIITFDPTLFNMPQIIILTSDTLTIDKQLTINGLGAALTTIDGNNALTVITVSPGAVISLNGLTIQHARNSAIVNKGTLNVHDSALSDNTMAYYGAGIQNWGGVLTVDSTTFTDNAANVNGVTCYGGGIDNNHGTVIITNSTFVGNSANSNGGGIVNGGVMTISNSTFFGNSAPGGGAIMSTDNLTISNSTFSGNASTQSGGGGILVEGGTLNLLSVISAKNISGYALDGPDVELNFGTVISYGHNLIGDGRDDGFTALPSDQVGPGGSPIDPLLGPLANNGGLTETMAISISSPAFQHGDCSGNSNTVPPAPAISTDQRGAGYYRKVNCDVGAFESTSLITPTATPTVTPTATVTATATTTPTSTQPPTGEDTIGVYRSGKFYLKLHNSTGYADLTVSFTAGTKPCPVVGDWTGAGFDTVGVYDQSNGQFSLRNTNTSGLPDKQFVLGNPNDQPLSGRWLLSATTAGVGVFRPSNGLIYLKDALTTGYAEHTMVLGVPSDIGLAGDWNGKGFDSPGVYRPSNSFFYLSNQVINGSVYGDYQLQYGLGGDASVVGDWIGQGHDGVGLFRQSNGFTYLKNTLTTGYADNTFTYGIAGDVPVAGHWQSVYPPIAPAPVLIAKTAIPPQSNGSVSGDNSLGD